MTELYVNPHHRLPDEEWAAVVRRAADVRQEVSDTAAGGASGPGGVVVDMTARGVASKKYFGVSGIPTQLGVLHSAECPLRAGYAIALSEWSSGTVHPAPPTASWQRFVDPVHRVRLIPDHLGAWHASAANVLSIGWEQAGYARFSREEWLTPDGRTMLENLALDMAEVAVRDGLPPVWLTTAQVDAILYHGDRTTKGFCTHRQIDKATRTDPGNGYPYDLLMQKIRGYMGTTTQEDDDMTLTPEQSKLLARLGQIAEAGETDGIRARIKAIDGRTLAAEEADKYVRSDHPDEDTLYEIIEDTGELRGITLDEWQLTGKGWRPWPKAVIDRLPKV